MQASAAPRTILGIPRAAAIWLVYLAFLAFQPLFDPDGGLLDWVLVAAMIAVFLPLYGWTMRHLDRRPYLWRGSPGALAGVAAIGAMGALLSPLNGGSSVFLVYAAASAGRVRPRRRAVITLALLVAATVAAAVVSPVPMPFRLFSVLPAAIMVPLLGLMGIYEVERERSNAKLRMAQNEVERLAAVAERERIARDMHDILGHTLSTITLKAELASRLARRDPERAEREMREVESIARGALGEVRAAVRGYRGSGIQGELASAKVALDAAGIEFDYFVAALALTPAAEQVLGMALREAVTNVLRHAHAQRCLVRLERDGSTVLLRVEDDGTGTAVRESSAQIRGGTGLDAMRERVRALGGHVDLAPTRSASRTGTRLDVVLPLSAAVLREAEAGS